MRRPTIVLTVLGASRSSRAASATVMPGWRAASRSSSDRAGGSGSVADAFRAARRVVRRTALTALSSCAASGPLSGRSLNAVPLADPVPDPPGPWAPPSTSFTELTIS